MKVKLLPKLSKTKTHLVHCRVVVQVIVRLYVSIFFDVRFIWKSFGLEHMVDSVDPESVSTFVQPVLESRNHFLVHFLILVVQVWLFLCELMEITLPSNCAVSPSACVENCNLHKSYVQKYFKSDKKQKAHPIVRVSSNDVVLINVAVPPNVVVLKACRAILRKDEPLVFVAGVIRNLLKRKKLSVTVT